MVEAAEWSTTSQSFGSGHLDQALRHQPTAGQRTSDVAYHAAASHYPRFDRQNIRTFFDDGILSGAKQPPPELLRNFPSREVPMRHSAPTDQGGLQLTLKLDRTRRSVSAGSAASGSAASRRTSAAGSAIAMSRASTGAGSDAPSRGYFKQTSAPSNIFNTTSSQYGAGTHVAREPLQGREVWMLGRGGGQQSSHNNCLVYKGPNVPA
eukprot:CAMPEP_0172719808 /NCGR_PEP_ID=MMETSP1074-20121228/75721_1 /TAXON_ID=2916 /ORGANISM="Ceratium fusus, Strain PA161109" /LENGTH=207 /DNA_ID=CAMNT_0013545205 /DNA_START=115 /DNA_END=738 /DNA_ORIENTATION=+